ncbi:MAG: heme exporter protein CcmB [Peptococcaceae bacterium]|nr:heme exporter protein CcmB [Peptococcaceae bacterium]
MNFLRKVQVLLWKEIKSELRAKEMLSAMLVFSLLVVVAFGFALDDLDKDVLPKILPGVIWVTLTFAGILGLNRSFVAEQQNDCLYGLMLCPADRSTIYVAKTIMNLLLMAIVELIAVPLFFIMFNANPPLNIGLFILILALGTYCFMAVGTFLSALAAGTRSSEILLPILMIPMISPVLICAVQVTKVLFAAQTMVGTSPFINLLVVYAILFTVLPLILFDYLLEV